MAKFQNRKKNYDGGNRPKLGGLRNGIFERAQAGDLGIEENQKEIGKWSELKTEMAKT